MISDSEVRGYLLGLRGRGVARGTFKTSHYGLRFLYRETLGRDWPLFGKKRYGSPSKSGYTGAPDHFRHLIARHRPMQARQSSTDAMGAAL